MKVGLVLGRRRGARRSVAHRGAQALATETGWDPGSADRIVGTSAGLGHRRLHRRGHAAVVHGRPLQGRDLRGPRPAPTGAPPRRPTARGGAVFRLHRGLPPIGPGSLAARRCPRWPGRRRHTPLELTVGWLPRGRDLHRLDQGHRAPHGARGQWVDHPSFWAVACDYSTGRRVAFGRQGAPDGRAGRRRGGVVRHPRLLPAGRRSAAAATWTAACARPRTSTCWPAGISTS